MAEGGEAAEPAREQRVVRVSAEDYSQDSAERASVKVICLGDSAVGKSK